jgi:hypothetical protein
MNQFVNTVFGGRERVRSLVPESIARVYEILDVSQTDAAILLNVLRGYTLTLEEAFRQQLKKIETQPSFTVDPQTPIGNLTESQISRYRDERAKAEILEMEKGAILGHYKHLMREEEPFKTKYSSWQSIPDEEAIVFAKSVLEKAQETQSVFGEETEPLLFEQARSYPEAMAKLKAVLQRADAIKIESGADPDNQIMRDILSLYFKLQGASPEKPIEDRTMIIRRKSLFALARRGLFPNLCRDSICLNLYWLPKDSPLFNFYHWWSPAFAAVDLCPEENPIPGMRLILLRAQSPALGPRKGMLKSADFIGWVTNEEFKSLNIPQTQEEILFAFVNRFLTTEGLAEETVLDSSVDGLDLNPTSPYPLLGFKGMPLEELLRRWQGAIAGPLKILFHPNTAVNHLSFETIYNLRFIATDGGWGDGQGSREIITQKGPQTDISCLEATYLAWIEEGRERMSRIYHLASNQDETSLNRLLRKISKNIKVGKRFQA